MKLYATTTSERASKGQGGKSLKIDIQDESMEVVATFSIEAGEEKTIITARYKPALVSFYDDTKGNKQKDS